MIQILLLFLTFIFILIGCYYKHKNDNYLVKQHSGFDYDRLIRTQKKFKRYMAGKGKKPKEEDLKELRRFIRRNSEDYGDEYAVLKDNIQNTNTLDDDYMLYALTVDDNEDVEEKNSKEECNMYHPDIIINKESNYNKRNHVDFGNMPNSLKDILTIVNHEHFTSDPAVGRDKELNALMRAILTPEKSALLIGEPGVGKSSIVKGLAYRIKCGTVPNALKSYTIIETSASKINSNCTLNGMLEKRVNDLLEFLKGQRDVLLFIDEIHTLIGTGRGTNHESLDIANILKPYLSSGQVTLIGATTLDEYEEFLWDDIAFKERFKVVEINEPDDTSLEYIVEHTIDRYCKEYHLKINNDLKRQLVKNLVYSTSASKRNKMDFACNPRLVVSVIAEAVGDALLNSSKELQDSNFKTAYESNVHLSGDYIPCITNKKQQKAQAKVINMMDFKKKLNY